MKKIKSRDVVKSIKERESKSESQNITFRLPKDLAENFKKICDSQDVSANAVINELIRGFVEDYK